MANKYVFNRDHIIVNGRTFPAKYTVMTGDCMSVELLVTVDGGEMARISVPPSDRQYKAALQAAQMGLTLEATAAPEDGGSASRDGSGCPAAAAATAAAEDGGSASRDGSGCPATAAATAAPEDGGSASRDGSGCPAAAADRVQAEPVNTAPETAAGTPEAAPETVDNVAAAAAALEPVVYATSVIDSRRIAPVDPAGGETVQAATETATAAAPDAETINNEEGATMNKSISTAADAVKAAAAAEAQELTAAADPKATRGPVPEKTFINEVIAGNGWSIVFDAGCNRTRVIITEPVKAAARPIVEEAGFYYSKNMDSWNKKLTFRARRAALNLADKLRAALA